MFWIDGPGLEGFEYDGFIYCLFWLPNAQYEFLHSASVLWRSNTSVHLKRFYADQTCYNVCFGHFLKSTY